MYTESTWWSRMIAIGSVHEGTQHIVMVKLKAESSMTGAFRLILFYTRDSSRFALKGFYDNAL